MEDLLRMKGRERPIARILSCTKTVRLVGYADGSHAVFQDHRAIGLWEPNETAECVATFLRIGEVETSPPILLLRLQSGDLVEMTRQPVN